MQTNTARNQLISDHTEVVRRIALKMTRRCPDWVVREDLISAGMLGLTEAASRYDHSRAEPFLAFAEHRIRGAILDELRRGDLLPRRVRQLAQRIASTIRDLESRGLDASDERVAEALGVTLEHYRTGLAHLVHVNLRPIDDEVVGIAQASERAPDEQAAHRQLLSRIRAALDRLGGRDVMILGLHFMQELTYQEIGKALGITSSRVCQLMARAIERLREESGATCSALGQAA